MSLKYWIIHHWLHGKWQDFTSSRLPRMPPTTWQMMYRTPLSSEMCPVIIVASVTCSTLIATSLCRLTWAEPFLGDFTLAHLYTVCFILQLKGSCLQALAYVRTFLPMRALPTWRPHCRIDVSSADICCDVYYDWQGPPIANSIIQRRISGPWMAISALALWSVYNSISPILAKGLKILQVRCLAARQCAWQMGEYKFNNT